jgi:hypothetical protein
MSINRSIRPLITLFGTIAFVSPFYFKIDRFSNSITPVEQNTPRRLEIAVDDSDPLVGALLSVVAKPNSLNRLSSKDHEKITAILKDARELMGDAKDLFGGEDSRAHELVKAATEKFKEAKDAIKEQRAMAETEESSNLKARRSSKRETEAVENEEEDTDLDVARNVYETYVTFPECVEKKFEDCLQIVNSDLQNLGLSTVEITVHEKRNINQDGYNKVVIVTNNDADQVKGRSGDGIVTYPFTWDDAVLGTRTLGVDGKWNCNGQTPEDCCNTIKDSAPNPDTKGNYIECHIFVPFGGKGNPRRDDRVIINLSPDDRVHEAPILQ